MQIQLYDTTLRDGTQGEGVSLSCDDKLRIARRLDEFGMKYIEGGWPGSNPKDMEFFERAQSELNLKQAKIAAFGSTCRADIDPADDPQIRLLIEVVEDRALVHALVLDPRAPKTKPGAPRGSARLILLMSRDSTRR